MKKLILIVALLTLFFCMYFFEVSDSTDSDSMEGCITIQVDSLNTIYRCIDEPANVVCYIFNGYNKGGLSCIPLSDTTLDY